MLTSWLWPVLAGPFVGSLLGVLVRRLPAGRPVVMARSACEACGRVLGAAELAPIISYAWLRGRCATCHARIAPAHLGIELAATVVAGTAVLSGLRDAALWANCGFGWILLALAWIDARHFRLPDVLTLPLILAGLCVVAVQDAAALSDHALAAAIGYSAFRLVAIGFRRLRGRDGLGEGDAKLLAAIGAWVGLEGLSPVILLGAGLALLYGLARVADRKAGFRTPIPFGPFLAAAGWAVHLHHAFATTG